MRPGGDEGRRAPFRRAEAGVRPSRRDTRGEPKTMSDVPANDTRENAPGPMPSRRSFLTRAAGASAVAVPAWTLLNSSQAKAGQPKSSKGKAAPPTKLTGLTATLLHEM